MTCIVGMVSGNAIYMGADSAGSNNFSYTIRKDPKVFINNEFLIGYTSSFRMGQLLMYCDLPKPKKSDKKDLFKFMVSKFIPVVRELLKDGGYSVVNSNEESGGVFLVGVNGRLFKIESDFQVNENGLGFDSCGCGEHAAMASMITSEKIKNKKCSEPCDRIVMALESAESIYCGVKAPFKILKQLKDKKKEK